MSQSQNGGPNQPPGQDPNTPGDYGRQIGDTVRSALQSGDLSRLKDIGPAVQGIVKSATSSVNVQINQSTQNNTQTPPTSKSQSYGGLRPSAPPRQPSRQRGPGSMSGIGSILLGVFGILAFGLGALAVGLVALVSSFTVATAAGLGALLGATGLSAALLGSGVNRRGLASRVRRYYAVLADKGYATFQQLALRVGLPVDKVKKDVRKAIGNTMMPDTHIDAEETTVMVGEEAYKLYLETEEARKKREEEEEERQRRLLDPSTANIEQFKLDGKAALKSIRAANDAIPGEEVSEKIRRLELTASKIFSYVQAHPEKLPETRKLMNYYLPTTLKLLEKYRQYDELEIQPANVKQTKLEIERSLDTINTAFDNLLNSLYKEDTLDVSTDISVLKTVLQQEGLVGHQFVIDAEIEEKSADPTFKEE